jgi:20S proteasome alpha/beta subunit
VTIGIALRCSDGIVLGSDRQMTRSGSDKFYQQKVFHDLHDDQILALTGADDPTLVKEVWDKLRAVPRQDRTASLGDCLESILNDMGRLRTDLPLQLLVGMADGQGTELVGFTGKGLYAIQAYEFVGAGDSSLLRFLVERLHRADLPVSRALHLGAYLLGRAKDYVDGCGGPSDMLALRPRPTLQTLAPEVVEKMDEALVRNEPETIQKLLETSSLFST